MYQILGMANFIIVLVSSKLYLQNCNNSCTLVETVDLKYEEYIHTIWDYLSASLSLFVCLFICLFLSLTSDFYVSACLSISLRVCVPLTLSLSVSVSLCFCFSLSVSLFLSLFFSLSLYIYIYTSLSLSTFDTVSYNSKFKVGKLISQCLKLLVISWPHLTKWMVEQPGPPFIAFLY